MTKLSNSKKDLTLKKELSLKMLENIHDSLKWSWQIVMGFAMVTAVGSIYSVFYLFLSHSRLLDCALPEKISGFYPVDARISIILFFLVFLPTFIRFFYGDNRYLDQHYLEVFLLASYGDGDEFEHELAAMCGRRRFFDILLLIFHGFVFVFLGNALKNPELFILLYAFLMLTNLLWLRANVRWNQTKETMVEEKGIKKIRKEVYVYPDRDRAPRFWIKNNICHFVVLAVLIYLYYVAFGINRPLYLLLSILCCVSNSVFDLWKTWFFYFPNVQQLGKDKETTARNTGVIKS